MTVGLLRRETLENFIVKEEIEGTISVGQSRAKIVDSFSRNWGNGIIMLELMCSRCQSHVAVIQKIYFGLLLRQ